MLQLNLLNTPNQQISTTISGVNYSLKFRTTENGILLCDMTIAGELVFAGSRCVANAFVIPAPYMTHGGNFFFFCSDNEYPDWNKFNDAHTLLYLTDAEIAENEL